jgi:ribosomal protein L11 methylase PrmA
LVEPDLLCDFLLELGACSVSLVDADAGTSEEEPIYSDLYDPFHDTVNGWHNGRPYWNRCRIVAQFPPTVYAGFTTRLLPLLHEQWEGLQIEQNGAVPSRDWVSFVQQNWRPLVVADTFLLTFPWHNDTDLLPFLVVEPTTKTGISNATLSPSYSSSSSSSPPSPSPLIRLQLQGGVAFGTGEHATTQLCLEWVRDNLRARTTTTRKDDDIDTTKTTEPPRSTTTTITILDYGTGSGILGIAACLYGRTHGISVTATGVDIDADACRIANANAIINDIPKTMMQSYLPPLHAAVDDESRSLLLRALQSQQPYQTTTTATTTTTAITGNYNTIDGDDDSNDNDDDARELIWRRDEQQLPPEQQFDLVVANILAGPLIALAPILFRFCRGSIGLSGILPHQGSAVVEAYTNAGFTNVVVAKELNGWILVTGDKTQPRPPQS